MKELTYGQNLVGYTFNPSSDVRVDKIKLLIAEAIDELKLIDVTSEDQGIIQEQAILKLLDAQMWSVKTLFTK